MNSAVNLSIFCVIAAALLGSMIWSLINCNNKDQINQYLSNLNKDQQEIYQNIVKERMNIYVTGFVLGLIVGIIYLQITNSMKTNVYCIFVAIVLGITYINYTVMPKSTYMLDHIETAQQAKDWLELYKHMKRSCHTGMILGVVSLPFVCYIFN